MAHDTLAPVRGNVPPSRQEPPTQQDTEEKLPKLTPLRREFLRLYLTPDTNTFMNATRSYSQNFLAKETDRESAARRGSDLVKLLHPWISKWLDEHGMGDVAIKSSIVAGMYAMETKFFQHEGRVTEMVDVVNWGTRYKFTELAAKVSGMMTDNLHIDGVSELATRMVTASKRVEEMRAKLSAEQRT